MGGSDGRERWEGAMGAGSGGREWTCVVMILRADEERLGGWGRPAEGSESEAGFEKIDLAFT
eukprot:330726-Rhodomonas_salina.2